MFERVLKNPFLILVCLLLLCMSIGISKSPRFAFEKSGVQFFNLVAWTHLRYGLRHTKGQDFLGYEKPYGHHPPGLGLTLALALYLRGFEKNFVLHPFLCRLVMVLFHIGSLYLLVKILKTIEENNLFIWIFGIFYCLTPMSNFFGKNVCHETPTLFFMLLSINFYIKRLSGKYISSISNKVSIIFSLSFACFFGWPAFFLVAVILVYEKYLRNKNCNDTFLRYMVISMIIVSVFIFGQLFLATGIQKVWEGFTLRVTLHPENPQWRYSINQWLIKLLASNRNTFTPVLHYMSIGGLLKYFRLFFPVRVTEKKKTYFQFKNIKKTFFLSSFAVIALSHMIIFHHGAWVHPYWQFYLIPIELYFATKLTVNVINNINSRFKISIYCLILFCSILFDMLNSWFALYHGYKYYQSFAHYIFKIRLIGTESLDYLAIIITLFVILNPINGFDSS